MDGPTPPAAGVFATPYFPYPRDAVRAVREIVAACRHGGFYTHSWAIVRDVETGLLAQVAGAVGVTALPASIPEQRCLPWQHFSVQIPGFGDPRIHPLAQDPAHICARANSNMSIVRGMIEESGRRIVVSTPDFTVEDIAYDGPYRRISPARDLRQHIEAFAAASVAPLSDMLFCTRAAGPEGPGSVTCTVLQ